MIRTQPTSLLAVVGASCVVLLASCQTPSTGLSGTSAVKIMDVNGAPLAYIEQGRGEPVVFVHGGIADYRLWDRQRAALAADGYRAIAYTQRYFGTAPWSPGWPPFGEQTHSDDLAAFIRGLGAGPVHVVAWSYSGHVALNAALNHPDLVKSAFVFEPAAPTYVTDAATLKAIGDDGGAIAGPVVQAMKEGDNAEAMKRLLDGVSERPGYFATQPAAAQAMFLDNARTVPPMFDAKTPQISCAQLAAIKSRVAIVRGDSRPYFKLIADEAARCMPSQKYIVVPKAKHVWPGEDVAGFNATLVAFLKGH
jgi:pimeloyl-ACP methyl ester carboxylesterase